MKKISLLNNIERKSTELEKGIDINNWYEDDLLYQLSFKV